MGSGDTRAKIMDPRQGEFKVLVVNGAYEHHMIGQWQWLYVGYGDAGFVDAKDGRWVPMTSVAWALREVTDEP